ncbi:YtxH domain-containing protein [Paenibacillus athensensis]|uniref:Gas vesicle protein n=1 Tax=Paenibacillus athensensis TaxID=1967502 RepID=A0A4Y8QA25_9BACL|nr:YtxH domain-containing protein [Paenibacillus athensensis]MCD1258996.1 YtxH domain-containing protein [Paenibacillus athensensis]
MTSPKRGKDLLIGAVVGSVLGAATALLFAPKSGRELRSDIAGQAQTISEKTQQAAAAVSQRTQEIAKTVGSTTSDWYGRAKEAASGVADGVRSWREGRREEPQLEQIEVSEAAEDLVIVGNR